MSDTEGTTPDWDRLLERFGDAYMTAYVEQTNSADARRKEAGDALLSAVASLTQDRDRWRAEAAQARSDALTYLANQGNLNLRLKRDLVAAREQAEQAQAAIAAVRKLHSRDEGLGPDAHGLFGCMGCDPGETWPCATLRALDATSAPQPKDADQPNDFDPVTGRLVPVVYAPQPKDAEPDRFATGWSWSCGQGRCESCGVSGCRHACHFPAAPAAAVPSSGGQPERTYRGMPVKHCQLKVSHLHHVYDDGDGKRMCIGTPPEASGSQDTAADDGFVPEFVQLTKADLDTVRIVDSGVLRNAEFSAPMEDDEPATAGGTAREVTLAEAAQNAIAVTLDMEQRRIAQAERETATAGGTASSEPWAAYRDQTDRRHREASHRFRRHVADPDGIARCDGSVLLNDKYDRVRLADVPENMRCQKRGCKERWPAAPAGAEGGDRRG